MTISASVLTLVQIAQNRQHAVLEAPFLPQLESPNKVRLKVTAVWFVASVAALPEAFAMKAASLDSETYTVYLAVRTLLLYVVPATFMAFTYARVFSRLRNLLRQELARSDLVEIYSMRRLARIDSRRNTTGMLAALTVVYLFTFLPFHCLNLVKSWGLLEDVDDRFRVSLSLVANWIFYFNTAVNPVICCIMSKQFREDFGRTLRVLTRFRPNNSKKRSTPPPSHLRKAKMENSSSAMAFSISKAAFEEPLNGLSDQDGDCDSLGLFEARRKGMYSPLPCVILNREDENLKH